MTDNKKWYLNFGFLWTGQMLSLLSTSIIQFVLLWWLTEKTQSAIYLSAATFVLYIPIIFIVPLISPLIDHCSRKKILIAASFGIGAVSTLLGISFGFEKETPLLILGAIFLRSTFNSIRWSTLEASAAQLVPESHLTQINAVDYILRGITGIIGPFLGAVLLQITTMKYILTVDLIAAVGGSIPLLMISFPKVNSDATQFSLNLVSQIGRSLSGLKSGFRYVRRTPGLFMFLMYVSITNLMLMPAESLLPLVVSTKFHGTEISMSTIGIAFGIGSVLGGIILSIRHGFHSRIKASLTGDLLYGFGIFLIGVASEKQFPLAVLGWGLAGIGESMSLANVNALIQAHTRPEMQGRVFSISTSLINISIPVAMIISGPVAEIFGIRFWYIFSGVGILLLAGGMMFVPAMFRLEKPSPAKIFDPSYE